MKKIIVLICLFLAGCASMDQGPTKSAVELQSIQAKDFETSKKIAFAATLSVFQDLGYIVESASFETGLITAKSPTKQGFVPFVGQVMKFVKATAFIEEVTTGRTKVRVNLVNSQNSSSGYGMKGESENPIEIPETYQDLFSKVQQAIFIRKNT